MFFSRSLEAAALSSKAKSEDKSSNEPAASAPAPNLSPATVNMVRLIISAASALCLALSKQIWIYSLQSEVFALNNFICASILYCAVIALSNSSLTAMKWGAFLTGLGVCHQHTSIFISIPSVLAIFASDPGVVWSNRNSLMLCGVCGLVPYLYLPIQYKFVSFGPYMNWGDVMSFGGFFHHFIRADYGTFQLGSDSLTAKITYLHRISVFLGVSLHEMHAIFVAGFLGAVYSIASYSPRFSTILKAKPTAPPKAGPSPTATCHSVLLFLSCTWVSYTLVFCYLANLDLQGLMWGVSARFCMQTNVIIALGGAAFTQLLLLHKLPQQRALLASSVVIAILAASIYLSVRSTCVVTSPFARIKLLHAVMPLSLGIPRSTSAAVMLLIKRPAPFLPHAHCTTADTFLYSFGKNVLQQLQPNSMLLTSGDVHCNIIDYLQQVRVPSPTPRRCCPAGVTPVLPS